jgi:hypothetical protein
VFVQTNKFYFLLFISLFEGFSLLIFVLLLFVWEENKCKSAEETKMEETKPEEKKPAQSDGCCSLCSGGGL